MSDESRTVETGEPADRTPDPCEDRHTPTTVCDNKIRGGFGRVRLAGLVDRMRREVAEADDDELGRLELLGGDTFSWAYRVELSPDRYTVVDADDLDTVLGHAYPGQSAHALVPYSVAHRALAEARSIDQVKSVRGVAVMAQVYARQARDREMEANAVEIRLRAERLAGKMLARMEKNRGAREHGVGRRGKNAVAESDRVPTLSDLGVTKTQSSRWQRLAVLDDAAFEARVAAARRRDPSGSIHRELRQREARAAAYEARIKDGATVEDLRALAASDYRAAVIYVDPPSRYDSYFGADVGGGADRHYDTMTVDELKAMGPLIRSLAAKDCALLYWTSGPQCANALEILKWWEFQYATWGFMWVKTNPSSGAPGLEDLRPEDLHCGIGWATQPNAEAVLLAKRGAPRRLACDVHQVVVAPAAAHSQKPEEVRRRIERLYPGPYLELFGRRPVAGWTVWGNEIPRAQFREAAE